MAKKVEEEEAGQISQPQGRHIKKRALRNKALSVGFDEKDLRDYVTGFHKRKKKRRKEAQQQQEEAKRRKRIEFRKKRKFERELAYGDGSHDDNKNEDYEEGDEDGDEELREKFSGTTMYDNGDMKVVVTTSEISHEEEEENTPSNKARALVNLQSSAKDKKHKLGVSKKNSFKRVEKRRSRPKPQSKREKRSGKKKNKTNR